MSTTTQPLNLSGLVGLLAARNTEPVGQNATAGFIPFTHSSPAGKLFIAVQNPTRTDSDTFNFDCGVCGNANAVTCKTNDSNGIESIACKSGCRPGNIIAGKTVAGLTSHELGVNPNTGRSVNEPVSGESTSKSFGKTAKKPLTIYTEKILSMIDFYSEAKAMGIEFVGTPKANGWAECRAVNRTDDKASAGFNIKTGVYKDHGGDSVGFFNLCVLCGKFSRWDQARDHYAEKHGLTGERPTQESMSSIDMLQLGVDWNSESIKGLTQRFPGITEQALLACGAGLGHFPKQSDSPHLVVCLPSYDINGKVCGQVVMRADGGAFVDDKGESVKRRTLGSCGYLGTHGFNRLLDDPATIEICWKAEGVTDLLVLQEIIPHELRDTHVVITNAGGATQATLPAETAVDLLDGVRKVGILHDADEAGQAGVSRWLTPLFGKVASLINVLLPYAVEKNHGKDLRDWINEGHSYSDLLELARSTPEVTAADVERAKKLLKKLSSKNAKTNGKKSTRQLNLNDEPEDSLLLPENQGDAKLSGLFSRKYSTLLNYVHERSGWIYWTGNRWKFDITGQQTEFAKKFSQFIWSEFEELEAETKDQESEGKNDNPLAALAKRSTTKKFLDDVVYLAKSERDMITPSSRLDCSPSLFNVMNGTIDLQTGKLRPHAQEDYITSLCQFDYNPSATCPLWELFVHQVMGGDYELISFLQTWFGYCITGEVREHKFPIFWGKGGNGKSVMLSTILGVIGEDYGHVAPPTLLLSKGRDEHPTILADLCGKRLVTCSETEEGSRFNESLLKQLTGGDRITARKLYQNYWEFNPSHKLVLSTNHKPAVRGTDAGVWRRILLIPFVQQFWDPAKEGETGPEEMKQDKNLPVKLMNEAPGILNWLIQGARNWYENGLDIPSASKDATAEYRDSENVIQQFLRDNCYIGNSFKVRGADFYQSYKVWAEASGEFVLSQTKFGRLMAEQFSKDSSNGIWYSGVGLREIKKSETDSH